LYLKEVVWCTSRDHRFSCSGTGVELEAGRREKGRTWLAGFFATHYYDKEGNVQRVFEMLIDLHDRGLVTAPIAIVWS
jgi:hypothetical protein